MVLVADSPCHGRKFHDTNDNLVYAAQIQSSSDICQQMKRIARSGIDFTFVEIVPKATAKMVKILQEKYKSTACSDGFQRAFEKVSLSRSADVMRFADVVHDSSSSTLSASEGRNDVACSRKSLGVSSYHHYGPTGLPAIAEVDAADPKECSQVHSVSAPNVIPLTWSDVDRSRSGCNSSLATLQAERRNQLEGFELEAHSKDDNDPYPETMLRQGRDALCTHHVRLQH